MEEGGGRRGKEGERGSREGENGTKKSRKEVKRREVCSEVSQVKR